MVGSPDHPIRGSKLRLRLLTTLKQGVGWLQRKLVGLATVTLSISQYKSEDSLTHIDIEVTATGGIKGTTEHRTLDWEVRGHKDQMFGEVKGQSRWIKLAELEDDTGDGFLKKAWLDEGEQYIQSSVTRVDGAWTSNQVGFLARSSLELRCGVVPSAGVEERIY